MPIANRTGRRLVDKNRRHILHVFPSFGVGGVPLRTVRLMNHFVTSFRHSVIALDQNFAAAEGFVPNLDVALVTRPKARHGLARALVDNAVALRQLKPDLLITYNWGAIEWAMADRLLPVSRQMHFEDGFGKEEADRQLPRRVLFRRWALARCDRVVVPSRKLEDVARSVWKLPAAQIAFIPNGVDLVRFADPPRDAIPGFERGIGGLVVGTVAPLRPEKNIGRLLRVFATLDPSLPARLVIAGDGSERVALTQLAGELGIAERVFFTGHVAPEAVLGTFDVFVLSSDTEQMPIAVLEAMAAGRAVAAVDVGDVRTILSEENQEFIVPRDDGAAFGAAIARLLCDPVLRTRLGDRNRTRAASAFSQQRMFDDYATLFGLNAL